MAHCKISSRGSQVLIFYLLVFARIHKTMYLNKMHLHLTIGMGYVLSLFYPCL